MNIDQLLVQKEEAIKLLLSEEKRIKDQLIALGYHKSYKHHIKKADPTMNPAHTVEGIETLKAKANKVERRTKVG